jgi:hypothetical protein
MIPMLWSVVLGGALLVSAIFTLYALFATFSPYLGPADDRPRLSETRMRRRQSIQLREKEFTRHE